MQGSKILTSNISKHLSIASKHQTSMFIMFIKPKQDHIPIKFMYM